MEKILYAEISAIGLIILAFIYIKNRKSTISAGDGKIFSYLLIVLACILITDGAMWILDGAEFIFVHEVYEICATLFFGGTGILGYLWVIFCKSKLFPLKKSLKHKLLLAVPLVLNYGFTIASIWTGWYFYIDEFNVYVRGNLFIIFSAISYSYFVYATVISLASVRKRDAAEKQDGYALASFLILPLIGSIFQVAFYGLSIVGVTFALSLLLVFFSVQDKQINIDFLTQLNNRRKMNEYLAVKTKNISNGKRLFAIMIDIDDFKSINDRFGHEVGDEALRCTANILRKASRTVNGFVARMSGDEFMIFFESDSTKNVLDFERLIESAFADFSSLSSRYPLAASMGCAEFGADGIDSPDKLLKAADEMMYINKTKRKHLNKEFSSGQECAELEN